MASVLHPISYLIIYCIVFFFFSFFLSEKYRPVGSRSRPTVSSVGTSGCSTQGENVGLADWEYFQEILHGGLLFLWGGSRNRWSLEVSIDKCLLRCLNIALKTSDHLRTGMHETHAPPYPWTGNGAFNCCIKHFILIMHFIYICCYRNHVAPFMWRSAIPPTRRDITGPGQKLRIH